MEADIMIKVTLGEDFEDEYNFDGDEGTFWIDIHQARQLHEMLGALIKTQ